MAAMNSDERRAKGLWVDVKMLYTVVVNGLFVAAGFVRTGGSGTDAASSGLAAKRKAIAEILVCTTEDLAKTKGKVPQLDAAGKPKVDAKGNPVLVDGEIAPKVAASKVTEFGTLVYERNGAEVHFAVATDGGCPTCGAKKGTKSPFCPTCNGTGAAVKIDDDMSALLG